MRVVKITPHWYGPYTVERVGRNKKVYYLQNPLGDSLKLPVSILRLRKYFPRDGEEIRHEKFPDEVVLASEKRNEVVSSSEESRTSKYQGLDDHDQIFGLSWVDPEESYMPSKSAEDVEEKEVLESLHDSKVTVSSRIPRGKRNTQGVKKYSGVAKNSSKRKGRMYS